MSKTNYRGIDYSMGLSNNDGQCSYGVIPVNEVSQFWYDESEPYYEKENCPYCGHIAEEWDYCNNCENELDGEFDCQEPISFYIDDKEYQAEQSCDNPDIFIMKSPYFTFAQYCSPCAPGAGYVLNYTDPGVGVRTYCFNHDCFKDGKAPYPVYSVKTGKRVEP